MVPAKTVAELIAYAKAKPGKVTIASFGTGTTSHVAGELFKMMAGIDLIHVPYRGGAAMMADLVAGQVQVGIDVLTGALPHIHSGAIRRWRWRAASDMRRFGYPDDWCETMPLLRRELLVRWGVGVPRIRLRTSSGGST